MARVSVSNVPGHSAAGTRSLAIHVGRPRGRVAAVGSRRRRSSRCRPATSRTYDLLGSPTLYPGQTVTARVEADRENAGPVAVGLLLCHATGGDGAAPCQGPTATIEPGRDALLEWQVPDVGGQPILDIGVEMTAVVDLGDATVAGPATVYLDRLGWRGPPNVRLGRPSDGGESWRHAWVDAVDHVETRGPEPYRVMQDRGTGLLMQGTEEWHDLTVETDLRIHMARAGGIAVHVRGLTRWVALLLDMSGRATLVRSQFERQILAERPLDLDVTVPHRLRLDALGDRIRASVDGAVVFDVRDPRFAAEGGAVALVCEEGRARERRRDRADLPTWRTSPDRLSAMSARKAPGRRRPTQADVARRAGVSQALVSYVLNESPVTLPDATRQRVLDAMDELGYVPHGGARALRLDRTMTLALVIPDITNPYYPAVERGLQDSAEAAATSSITYNTDGVAAKERKALRSIRETRADGAVIYDFHLGPDDYRSLLDAGTALAMVVSTPAQDRRPAHRPPHRRRGRRRRR